MDIRKNGSRQALVRNTDMEKPQQQQAVECAAAAIDRFEDIHEVAKYIKLEFDKRYHGVWHCMVGTNFGCYVAHQPGTFIYFLLGKYAILLFQGKAE